FDRAFEDGFRLDPDRVRHAMTSNTRLIVVTSPHNPCGAIATRDELLEVGRIAESHGAHVLVDEVYLDVASDGHETPAAQLGEGFLSTRSLTKHYGLRGL